MKSLVITAGVLLLAGGSFFGYGAWRQAEDDKARYLAVRARLESLLVEVYEPPDRPADGAARFRELGCKDEDGPSAKVSPSARRAEAEQLLAAHGDLLARLGDDDSAAASYLLATLQKMHLGGAREEGGLALTTTTTTTKDPEVNLRQAAAKGYGPALFYFAQLAAESEAQAASGGREEQDFFELNQKLEVAATSGSGAAAYLLGFRASRELFTLYAGVEPSRRTAWQEQSLAKERLAASLDSRVPGTTRTPREWWCRAAELGHASGQLNCFRYGRRPQEVALRWLGAAADAGQEAALFTLASLTADGRQGVAKDEKKAARLYCLSLFNGHRQAATALVKLKLRQKLDEQRRLAEEKRLSKLTPKARRAELARLEKQRAAKERELLRREAQREEAAKKKTPPATTRSAAGSAVLVGPAKTPKPAAPAAEEENLVDEETVVETIAH